MRKTALLSEDGVYRWQLTRQFYDNEFLPLLPVCMLNPSTADADVDDPTIRWLIRWAQGNGWGGIVVVNMYALRATDPKVLKTHPDPVGTLNDHHLYNAGLYHGMVVCAWGAHVKMSDLRTRHTIQLLRASGPKLMRFGSLTKGGCPRHPLYLPSRTELFPFEPREE